MKDTKKQQNIPTKPSIKWVKKANQFCLTYWENNIQKQIWNINKLELEEYERTRKKL